MREELGGEERGKTVVRMKIKQQKKLNSKKKVLGLETAHQVKVLDSTPEDVDLNLIAGTHMVEREMRPSKRPPIFFMCTTWYAPPNKYVKQKCCKCP